MQSLSFCWKHVIFHNSEKEINVECVRACHMNRMRHVGYENLDGNRDAGVYPIYECRYINVCMHLHIYLSLII